MIWQLIDSSGVGGAERHVATLTQTLQSIGVGVQVVLLKDHGANPWIEQLRQHGLPYEYLDGTLRQVSHVMRRRVPSLVHTHGYKAGLYGRLAARQLGIPIVSTFHSGERSAWPVAAYELCDEWSAFLSENIAVSSDIAARLPCRATVMSSYVRLPVMPTGPLPRKVAFVGRLSSEKGPERFCQLAETDTSGALSWDVYGDGALRATLQARYGGVVRFHGAVADMDRVWPTIGLLVMPSLFEGVPLAALEAMSFGVPVLAAPVGGLKCMIQTGVNGWHLGGEGAQSGLRELDRWRALSPAQESHLRTTCRAYVAEHFSMEAQFGKLVGVYERAGLAPRVLEALNRQVDTTKPSEHLLPRVQDRPAEDPA